MKCGPNISIASLEGATQFAPLVALGSFVRQEDLWAPVLGRVRFEQATHTEQPVSALLDLGVSILAGCRSVHQINTRLRPDRTLAQSWGRTHFAEQSTIARVLDCCEAAQVEQMRRGLAQLFAWTGQTPNHDWETSLMVDIDLTPLPAGRRAEGSTKGYFTKKGGVDDNCADWEPRRTTKPSAPGSIRATPWASMCCKRV